MAFRFALQKVVDLKRNEKTQSEWMLSAAVGVLREEELTLNALYEERNRTAELLHNAVQQGAPVADIRELQHYIDHLEERIKRKRSDLFEAQRHVEQKQQVLLDKTLDEKVWLKAREKAYQQFRTVMLRKEQHELDEIATMRHGLES